MKDDKNQIVSVDCFIEEQQDTAAGIRKAVQYAADHQLSEVRFGKGTYDLSSFVTIHTTSIAHDDGCGDVDQKDCHLLLQGLSELTLSGEIRQDGSPATILRGIHRGGIQCLLPSILWAENCRHLVLKNLAFTREPEMASAGVVTDIREDVIEVQVFEGLPCEDGMAAYCMNRFDREQGKLLGESLTYGFGYDNRFQKTGDRLLQLRDSTLAEKVKPGEGLSWHQSGKTDFQLFFGGCQNLTLENIRIMNTNGFGILTENCRDMTAKQLVIKPNKPQFFTGPRDGWKIYRCSGSIVLDQCHIEGVRMDGQNVHSNYLVVEQVETDKSLICRCKYAPIPLSSPCWLEFSRGTERVLVSLTDWEIAGSLEETSQSSGDSTAGMAVAGEKNHITRYRLMVDHIPEWVRPGTLAHGGCWEPESYICRNSVFKNIAGAGQLLRCGHVTISGCHYENMMNAGILIGAELDTHCEGGHGNHIRIEGCSFKNCGTKPRYGQYGKGGIAVKSQGFQGPYNRDIEIANNYFQDCHRAIELYDCRDVVIKNNFFKNCEETVYRDLESTVSIKTE